MLELFSCIERTESLRQSLDGEMQQQVTQIQVCTWLPAAQQPDGGRDDTAAAVQEGAQLSQMQLEDGRCRWKLIRQPGS